MSIAAEEFAAMIGADEQQILERSRDGPGASGTALSDWFLAACLSCQPLLAACLSCQPLLAACLPHRGIVFRKVRVERTLQHLGQVVQRIPHVANFGGSLELVHEVLVGDEPDVEEVWLTWLSGAGLPLGRL
jgi:hypothetical protein